MKVLLLLATCSLAAGTDMTARFANDDTLHGTLEGIEDQVIRWRSEDFQEPQELLRDRFVDVLLPGDSPPELPDGDHIAYVTLTNGDELQGTLLKVSDKEIGLRTGFAGDLVFRRDMVATLDIDDRPDNYYAGPTSIEDWTLSEERGWELEGGALVSRIPSSIGRDMGAHDRFRLSFDLEWDNAKFKLFTCADAADPTEAGNYFEFVCQTQYAYMRKRIRTRGRVITDTIGSTGGMREFQDHEKVRIELLQDQRAGRIRLMLNGRVAADWRDTNVGAKMGGAVIFEADPGSKLRISRIRVSSWDGTIEGEWREEGFNFMFEEEPEDEAPPADESDQAGIRLRNGDRLEGEALGIEDGRVRIKTPFKDFELPVSRLRSFSLRTAEEAEDPELCWKPIRRAGDIRATFIDGGAITFEFIGFGEDTIRGRSQTFGEADFLTSAFSRLEFNLYPGLP